MATGSRKKRVKVEEEAEAVPVDRLSSLQESLLFHILSFLPTEKVVAMSILSKRWQNVWRFVDTINFSSSHDWEDGQYARAVYKVMLSHKGECVKRVTLRPSGRDCSSSDVKCWMSFALDHGVECLELIVRFVMKPPPSLFTSKTLVKLSIMSADITSVNVLGAPLLPKLKELCLVNPKYDTESLRRFITGCTMLELFSLTGSNLVGGIETWDISSPTLKRLELHHSTINKNAKIRLAVPALEFFRVKHPVSDIIVEDKLYSLVEADIAIADDSHQEIMSRFFQLPNVKTLRLRTTDKPMISAMHAQFPNLTKLEIVSPYFELILVQNFLEAATNLEVISIDKSSHSSQEHQVSWNEPLHVPKCLLSSLKKMSIKGYGGKDELAMVNYVLRNAEVLEMMEIHCSVTYDYHYDRKFRMLQEITKMNRGSRRCQISFC